MTDELINYKDECMSICSYAHIYIHIRTKIRNLLLSHRSILLILLIYAFNPKRYKCAFHSERLMDQQVIKIVLKIPICQ